MSRSPSLYSFPSVDHLAKELRGYILTAQDQALERHSRFRVAVSGGSLPRTLAKALLDPADGAPLFEKWDVFFADERCVPLDHEDSNYRLVKEEWLDKLPADAPKPTVFPIDTQYLDDAQELADRYEQELVRLFAARDSVRIPMFDLILLGCGPDGHTCSLFPRIPAAARDRGLDPAHRRQPEAAAHAHHLQHARRQPRHQDCLCRHGRGEEGDSQEDIRQRRGALAAGWTGQQARAG